MQPPVFARPNLCHAYVPIVLPGLRGAQQPCGHTTCGALHLLERARRLRIWKRWESMSTYVRISPGGGEGVGGH